jgi:hypothetical protein
MVVLLHEWILSLLLLHVGRVILPVEVWVGSCLHLFAHISEPAWTASTCTPQISQWLLRFVKGGICVYLNRLFYWLWINRLLLKRRNRNNRSGGMMTQSRCDFRFLIRKFLPVFLILIFTFKMNITAGWIRLKRWLQGFLTSRCPRWVEISWRTRSHWGWWRQRFGNRLGVVSHCYGVYSPSYRV